MEPWLRDLLSMIWHKPFQFKTITAVYRLQATIFVELFRIEKILQIKVTTQGHH